MLQVQKLSKSFGTLAAVRDVSFTLQTGETLAVLGPSGCGKSTLLSLIAGLIAPDAGDVLWEGHSLAATPPHLRHFGLMFQDYALFPHLTVLGNVEFGLTGNRQQRTLARQMLARVGLSGFENRDVQTLSGGEAQRTALARALAPRPRLLMLDEPLGALDRALREQLTGELRGLLRELQQTAIYVTHDQQEAFSIADKVLVMNGGRVEQVGNPLDVYGNPASEFVRQFLGQGKLVRGTVHYADDRHITVETASGDWQLPASGWQARAGDEAVLLLRAEGARLNPASPLQRSDA